MRQDGGAEFISASLSSAIPKNNMSLIIRDFLPKSKDISKQAHTLTRKNPAYAGSLS